MLFVFNPLGTPSNTAIHKYMNDKKVPQLFVATGATKWGDPKNFPWTMGWQPNYQTEGKIYAAHILETKPNAKIGVLYQNDDYGKDYLKGFEDGLGDKAKTMIVSKVTLRGHRPDGGQPDGDAQGLGRRHLLQHHDAEVRGAGDQEGGRDRLEADALPEQRVGLGRLGADAGGAGERRRHHHHAATSRTRPTRRSRTARSWDDWMAWMKKYYPSGDIKDANNVYGYTVAQGLVQVLKQCGDNLTRDNVMKQAASLDMTLPMLLPGVNVKTGPNDFYPIEREQLASFDGKTWVLFGKVYDPGVIRPTPEAAWWPPPPQGATPAAWQSQIRGVCWMDAGPFVARLALHFSAARGPSRSAPRCARARPSSARRSSCAARRSCRRWPARCRRPS